MSAPRRRFGIVEEFALRSLFFVIVMALLLGATISVAVRTLFVDEAAKTGMVTTTAVVSHHVVGVDLESPTLPPSVVAALDDMANEDLVGAGITTIKLWNSRGVLLYSSDGQKIGQSFADHPPFAAALAGKTEVEVANKADAENEAQFTRDGRVIEVYSPLVIDGRTVGVFEIYQRYAPVASTINRFLLLMWLVILGGSIPAYFLQLKLVGRTADQLLATQDDLVEVGKRLTASLEDMEIHSLGTLQALVAAVDAKDSYTARHAIAVTDHAVAIARRMGLSAETIADVERAGLLHDVGKIGTPETILLKPERLTDDEFSVIAEHSEVGGHIIESVPFLAHLMPVIRSHHERWDGAGYPDGLMGERIPAMARILTAADAFDAMISERPYRKPLSLEVARAEMVRCAGTQFDPAVVTALLEALDHGEIRVVDHTESARARRRKTLTTA